MSPEKARLKREHNPDFSKNHGKPVIVSREMIEKLIKDLHSKDINVEHIGFLGGTMKGDILYLTHYNYSNSGASVLVEADPRDHAIFADRLEEKGRFVTSWWHTHPGFGPYPITREHDMRTQKNFKSLFKNAVSLVFDTKNREFSAFTVDVENGKSVFVFVPIKLKSKHEIKRILEEKT